MQAESARLDNLFAGPEFPSGFAYPAAFLALVKNATSNLAPWHVGGGAEMRELRAGLRQRYPSRDYLPFAYRQDNEGRACWDLADGLIVHVHDSAAPGRERRAEFEFFED